MSPSAARRAAASDQPSHWGKVDAGARAVCVGGVSVPAAMLSDLTAGGVRPAAAPTPRAADASPYELVYGLPDEAALPALLQLGYRKLGETRRFEMLLRHGSHLQRKIGAGAGTIVGAGLDIARALVTGARAVSATRRYRLDWGAGATERFDDLWQNARGDYPVIATRDAAFVRARFLDRPAQPIQIATLVDRGSGALAGYAAVALEGSDARFQDLFARRAALEPLLRLLAAVLAWKGITSISVRLCGAAPLVTCLTDLGFREHRDGRIAVIDAAPALRAAQPQVLDVDQWYLTDADRAV